MSNLARPEPNKEFFVHDHDGFRRLSGAVIDGDEIVERRLGNDAEARPEAEGVREAARDDAVGDADVDHIGQFIAGRRLRRGQADVAGITADDAGHASRIHFLDLGGAAIRRRLRVAEHGIDLGAAERLDAAGGIDFVDREGRAEAALLSGIRQGAGHWMQYAELHRLARGPQHRWHSDAACRDRRRADGGAGQKPAAVQRSFTGGHDDTPFVSVAA